MTSHVEVDMVSPDDTTRILMRVEHALGSATEVEEAAAAFMRILKAELPHVSWVGVYWLHGKELALGPYVGPEPDHVRIAVGEGVCGTAIAEGTNQIVHDVRARESYLACSPTVRAEIVVLIRDSFGGVLGQIDADSDEVGAFDHTDEMLLEAVAGKLATFARRRGGTPDRTASRANDD
jgi:L-methionine (R)-S-oxide reductase